MMKKMKKKKKMLHVVQIDLFFLWEHTYLLIVDEATRYKQTVLCANKESEELQRALLKGHLITESRY